MKNFLLAAFSLFSVVSFAQTNTPTPDPNNNGVPLQYRTYPPQPATVTTNPVDRSDVNNNIRPDTTFLKGKSPDITPTKTVQPRNPPKNTKTNKQ